MANLIAAIILIGSVLGIIFILFRKIPVLLELPEVPEGGEIVGVEVSIQEIKGKIKKIFPHHIVLQKILSRIRIIVLKIERKIDNLLQSLRKKAQERREEDEGSPE